MRNFLIVAGAVLVALVLWNYTGPVLRAGGRFIGGGIAALNGEAPATNQGLTTDEVAAQVAYEMANAQPEAPEAPTALTAPIAPAVNDACYGVIDGSVVPYGGKVEFAASTVNTVNGPAVIEWWDGEGGAGHEGMFYVPEGQTLTLPRTTRGGYWQIVASSAMTAEEGLAQLVRSHAHLVAFATKPQHAYATAALQAAYATCDWGDLEDLLVFLPEGAVLK